jgi:chitinase
VPRIAQSSRQARRFLTTNDWISNASNPSPLNSSATAVATSAPPFFLNGVYVPDWQECDAGCIKAPVTHVNYAFASIHEDRNLSIDNDQGLETWRDRRANQEAFKLLLAVGGGHQAATEAFVTIDSDPRKREQFAQSALGLVEQYGLDSIDIDWEYPNYTPSADQYSSLISALRAALGEDRLMSTTLPADKSILQYTPFDQLADKLDYLNPMAYDFVGASSVTSAFTGHHAGLFSVGAQVLVHHPPSTTSQAVGSLLERYCLGSHSMADRSAARAG